MERLHGLGQAICGVPSLVVLDLGRAALLLSSIAVRVKLKAISRTLAVSACARRRPARRRAAERVCAAHQLLRLHSEPGVLLVCPAGEPGVERAANGRALMQGYN